MDKLKHEHEKTVKQMNAKANVKDVCTLIDMKANTDDVFKVFEEIKRSVDLLQSK